MDGAETDNTWYVAIMQTGNRHYPFIGAGSSFYRGFSKRAEEQGMNIVAERFGATDEEVDRLTGVDEYRKRTKRSLLRDLVDSLDRGSETSPQEALDRL